MSKDLDKINPPYRGYTRYSAAIKDIADKDADGSKNAIECLANYSIREVIPWLSFKFPKIPIEIIEGIVFKELLNFDIEDVENEKKGANEVEEEQANDSVIEEVEKNKKLVQKKKKKNSGFIIYIKKQRILFPNQDDKLPHIGMFRSRCHFRVIDESRKPIYDVDLTSYEDGFEKKEENNENFITEIELETGEVSYEPSVFIEKLKQELDVDEYIFFDLYFNKGIKGEKLKINFPEMGNHVYDLKESIKRKAKILASKIRKGIIKL